MNGRNTSVYRSFFSGLIENLFGFFIKTIIFCDFPVSGSDLIFQFRPLVIFFFILATLFMLWSATALKVDAGFNKLLPLDHPYMKTFVKYQEEFGGANRILIAITVEKGDIFTSEFFNTLKI